MTKKARCLLLFTQFQIVNDSIYALDETGIIWRRKPGENWIHFDQQIEGVVNHIPNLTERKVFTVME